MRPTILIAEDEVFLQKLYRKKFEIEGYQVNVVSNGERALKYLRNNTPDIILLDIGLPRLSGLEVLQRVKSDPSLRCVPVMILTGLLDADKLSKAREYGADGYLIKSETNFSDLIRFISETIRVKNPPQREGTPGAHNANMLIVDDDAVIRSMYQKRFLIEGYAVETATNGDEAIEVLDRGQTDIVLLDVMLPKSSGFKVLAYMQLDENLKHIPVVMLTSLHSFDVAEMARKLGASSFIVKSQRNMNDVVRTVNDRCIRAVA